MVFNNFMTKRRTLSLYLKDIVTGLMINSVENRTDKLRNRKNKEIEPTCDLEKYFMLANISRLYSIPEFEMDNPTMDKELINILYDVTNELLLKYSVDSEHRMQYIASNFNVNTNDRIELISALEEERNNPNRDDSRYRMGFRSVYVLISDNIDKIKKSELKEILEKLKPFFDNYKRKDLLNQYVK